MILTTSDELVSARYSMKEASQYDNYDISLMNTVLSSPSARENLDGLIDYLDAVVTIGTSIDEEAIELSSDHLGSDVLSENRYDEECSRNDRGVCEVSEECIAVLEQELMSALEEREDKNDTVRNKSDEDERMETGVASADKCNLLTDDLADNSARDQHEAYEVESAGLKVKFGSHMLRDSICINSKSSGDQHPVKQNQAPNQNVGSEGSVECKTCSDEYRSVNGPAEDGYQALVPAENSSVFNASSNAPCVKSTKYIASGSSHNSRPLVSILKRTNSVPLMTASYHSRLKIFSKPKVPLSPHLKSLTSLRTKQRSVEFSSVQLRTYPIVLGDNPNCKFGAPLSIGWEYDQCDDLSVDIYETHRVNNRRKMKELYLNSGRRMNLLTQAGYSMEDISEAINDVQMIRLHRKQSAEDEVGILSFIRGAKPHIPPVGLDMNLKGWNKNKSFRLRMLELLPSSKHVGKQSK